MGLFKPAPEKAEFAELLGRSVGQARKRTEVINEISARPPVIDEPPASAEFDDTVATLLVGEDEAKNRAEWWHYAGELVTAELQTLDRLDWILANTKVFIDKDLAASLAAHRHQCAVTSVLVGVQEDSIVAALLDIPYQRWLERPHDERQALREAAGL